MNLSPGLIYVKRALQLEFIIDQHVLSTIMCYLITRQTVQTRILFDISSSDIKASAVKGTSHSVTNQHSWFVREHAVNTSQTQRRYYLRFWVYGNRRLTFDKGSIVMRTLASNGTVLTQSANKQHLLVPHGHFLHPL